MLSIVKQTIDFYTKNLKKPELTDLNIENSNLLNEKSSLFVTIYHKGEIRGSAGNIKEISDNSVLELVENTISAISKDSRFKPLSIDEAKNINIRVDKIVSRNVLESGKIKEVEPATSGILVLKKDYSKMACILPNINPILLTGEDFIPVIKSKLNEKSFEEKDYIIYEIKTETTSDLGAK